MIRRVPALLVGVLALLALVWAAGPSLLKPRLEAALSRAAGRPATIRAVGLTSAGFAADEVAVTDLLSVPHVRGDVDWAALAWGKLVVTRMRLDQPHLTWPVEWHRPARPSPAGSAGGGGPSLRASLETLQLVGAVVTLPGGGTLLVDGTVGLVSTDPSSVPSTLSVVAHAPAIGLHELLGGLGLPDDANGTAALDADLHAEGADQAALLRSVTGHASLTMGEGELDNRLLGAVFGAIRLPVGAGRTHVRCLALRTDVTDGIATFGTILADTTRLLVEGHGEVRLPDQTLNLRLRPLLRAGPGVVIPIVVRGPWTRPEVAPDNSGQLGQGTKADACLAAGIDVPPAKPPKPADLLRSLLR